MGAPSVPAAGFWEVEVAWREPAADPRGRECLSQVVSLIGSGRLEEVQVADLYFFRGERIGAPDLEDVSRRLLADPVTQHFEVRGPMGSGGWPRQERDGQPERRGGASATVIKKPGVMDPVEGSLLGALADLGWEGLEVRTGTRYRLLGELPAAGRRTIAEKVLSNPAIEAIHWHDEVLPSPFLRGEPYVFSYQEVALAGLSDQELAAVSRERQLSLSLEEMRAVRDHFARLGRPPSDAELETIAQTWSEHCCHKTFTGLIEHRRRRAAPGAGERDAPGGDDVEVESIDNLLRATIRRATEEIAAPWCLSVFRDNAGAIAFDDDHAVTFKVETHNHPSAIEPYGGAGTGIGGVLRDTLGTGLGAKPIASTDVFCFGPPDLGEERVPPGALHPLRVLRGVVGGVRDYGNRMGIPTASGAVYFDERYTGNPLVYCGSVGLLPKRFLEKHVEPGDRIYVLGGRTGRDGIHGATFSSQELTEHSERISSGAVQIGNAITEKRVLDVLLRARDAGLFRSVTDCGAGGLSSAVGEMGAPGGARVELERVPLKYEGLNYWEIWISEAQERMVLAVPPARAAELEELARGEEVEATDIGSFTATGRLELFYAGNRVADLGMEFLHEGRPRWRRRSEHLPLARPAARWEAPVALGRTLRAILASPNVASKEWIIRQYDHEVQGGSVLKPLQGPAADGPGDGVAFAPVAGSRRGIVIGCGMNPRHGDLDPYRMALSAVDEAVRNVVAAGGDPARTALLDNFSWGNTERPETLGTLVEAARGCHAAAVGLGTPFISGKDSLNNEYRWGERTISIPPSLLISSLSVVEDVTRLVSMDLKEVGSRLILVGETWAELGGSHYFAQLGVTGGEVPDLRLPGAARIHRAVAEAIRRGQVLSCHDLSEGGLAVAAAEMAFAGEIGVELRLDRVPRSAGAGADDVLLFSESNARYLIEVRPGSVAAVLSLVSGLPAAEVGETIAYKILRVLGRGGRTVLAETLADLKAAWQGTLWFSGRPGTTGTGTGTGKRG